MSTAGNEYHQPWPRCSDCGLSAPGVHTLEVCMRVKAGKSISGKSWNVTKFDVDALPEPPPPDYQLGPKPPPREGDSELANRPPEEWPPRHYAQA